MDQIKCKHRHHCLKRLEIQIQPPSHNVKLFKNSADEKDNSALIHFKDSDAVREGIEVCELSSFIYHHPPPELLAKAVKKLEKKGHPELATSARSVPISPSKPSAPSPHNSKSSSVSPKKKKKKEVVPASIPTVDNVKEEDLESDSTQSSEASTQCKLEMEAIRLPPDPRMKKKKVRSHDL